MEPKKRNLLEEELEQKQKLTPAKTIMGIAILAVAGGIGYCCGYRNAIETLGRQLDDLMS